MSDSNKRDVNKLGQSFIFPPNVIDDIHIKAELGRYRMRGFSLFKKIPTWDDLTFLPGTLTRFVIEGYREKCLTKTVIGPRAKKPIVGAPMSLSSPSSAFSARPMMIGVSSPGNS